MKTPLFAVLLAPLLHSCHLYAAPQIECPNAFWTIELMGSDAEQVYVHRSHIQRKNAHRLDGVDTEKNVALAAELANRCKIVTLTAGVFNVRKSQQAGARVVGGFQ